MCRLLAFYFNTNTSREERVSCIDSFKKLSVTGSVLNTSSPGHADGWGITVYRNNEEFPYLYKSVLSAVDDNDFKTESFLSESSAESGIAHLRKKTVGETSILNTHPFVEGVYSFIHNGTISRDDELYQEVSLGCRGSTDSERIFRKFLTLKNNATTTTMSAYTKMINETRNLYPSYSAINTILHDGDCIYVSRVINTKNIKYESCVLEDYYTLYVGRTTNNDVIISSEKIPHKDIVYSLLPNESISVINLKNGFLETNFLI